jgi:hypothetical protein
MGARIATILILAVLAAPAAAQLTVTTDADTYTTGDTVTITVVNAGPEPALFISTPAFAIVNTDSVLCVFGCTGLPEAWYMAVGDTMVADWDTGRRPDPAGHYNVHLHAVTDNPGSILDAGYDLVGPVPAAPTTWSDVRALYRGDR